MKREKDNRVLVSVKPYVQVNNYECGLACMQTILSFCGIRLGRLRLKQELGTSRDTGTSPDSIKRLLRSKKIKFRERHGVSVSELENRISRGEICLVAYQAWGAKKYFKTLESGHYSIVIGFDNESLWLMDPNVRGGRVRDKKGVRKIDKVVFEKRWVDEDVNKKEYDHWFLGISKNPLTLENK